MIFGIDGLHFVFGIKKGSFGIPSAEYATFLNEFNIFFDGDPFVLPIGEDVPEDAPIMSKNSKDYSSRIVISKDRINIFFDNSIGSIDIEIIKSKILDVYEKIKIEQRFSIEWIGLVTYNSKTIPGDNIILNYLNKDKLGQSLSQSSKINLSLERNDFLFEEIGKQCNSIIKIFNIPNDRYVMEYDINTKPSDIVLDRSFLYNFINGYFEKKNSIEDTLFIDFMQG